MAIKKVPKAFDDVVDAKRVSREIKLLRFMNHENVCGVFCGHCMYASVCVRVCVRACVCACVREKYVVSHLVSVGGVVTTSLAFCLCQSYWRGRERGELVSE